MSQSNKKQTVTPKPSGKPSRNNSPTKLGNNSPLQKGYPDSGDLGGRGATIPKTLRPPKKQS